MAMNFMKRGIKRRADELREVKEVWEREMDEMMRQRHADSEDDDEQDSKPEEEVSIRSNHPPCHSSEVGSDSFCLTVDKD